MSGSKPESKQNQVAVIGMACLFPGAPGTTEFWRLLLNGDDAVTHVPDTHWSKKDYFDPDPKKPDHVYCARGGFLEPVVFDPTRFGIPPSILQATDTAQLLSLLAAQQSLEDAGYGQNLRPFDKYKTGVVLGVTGTQELTVNLSSRLGHPKWRKALTQAGIDDAVTEKVIQNIADQYVDWQENSFPGLLGNVVAGRICNRLDIRGVNCAVDAACASSMGAVNMALLELLSGRSDMMITGGADTLNDIFMHMCFAKTRILSPTEDARPFSARADGTILGEGVGMVVLKRLADAEADGDRIYARIVGIGSSSDGKFQSIYAPAMEGQVRALESAYEAAGVSPDSVDLLEAHGTGTKVGDRVEFAALGKVFGSRADKTRCALGSVKSMIGHTKAAAGAAGLIKAVLGLYHKVLPPTLKADQPDEGLDMAASPFYLNQRSRPWFSPPHRPRRAGVSAFGFGGSNFHLVLQEAETEKIQTAWDGRVQILAFGGESEQEIRNSLEKFRSRALQAKSWSAIHFLAHGTRRSFSSSSAMRLLVILDRGQVWDKGPAPELARLLDQAAKKLGPEPLAEKPGKSRVFFSRNFDPTLGQGKGPVFLFPGQGSQRLYMGAELACVFPEAFEAIRSMDAAFGENPRLSDMIYPPGFPVLDPDGAEKRLTQTRCAQPAIGAVCLAMIRVLDRFGVHPSAACGHSYGELTALMAANVISEPDFFRLSVTRGRVMQEAAQKNSGAMLAMAVPIEKAQQFVKEFGRGLVLANKNTPRQAVLSGTTAAIDAAAEKCREKKWRAKKLPVSAAFHSPLVQNARAPFAKALESMDFHAGNIPVISNETANPYPRGDDARGLLGRHMVNSVDFIGDMEHLYDAGHRTFVEVGPSKVLTGLCSQVLKGKDVRVFAMDDPGGHDQGLGPLARLLCQLSARGQKVRFDRWDPMEGPDPTPKFSIVLTGANLGPDPEKTREKPGSGEPDSHDANDTYDTHSAHESRNSDNAHKNLGAPGFGESIKPRKPQAADSHILPPTSDGSGWEMKKENTSNSAWFEKAFEAVQEGMKSIQALHFQTAETHRKFLETQTQAGKALEEMMASTRRLAEAAMGSAHALPHVLPEGPPPQPRPAPEVHPNSAPEPAPVEPPPASPKAAVAAPSSQPPPSPAHEPAQQPPPKPAPGPDAGALTKTVRQVVCRLTGYPEEMIGLDMDMESDLGIDSIKRVEILSALEESTLNLPQIPPEELGNLRTLGQIIQRFCSSDEKSEPAPETRPSAPENQAVSAGRIYEHLLQVVSRLTGYPMEMLDGGMDMESDLGIDSIKRVEILSAMEEALPGTAPGPAGCHGKPAHPGSDRGPIGRAHPRRGTRHLNRQKQKHKRPRDPDPPRAGAPAPNTDLVPRRVVAPVSRPFSGKREIPADPTRKVYLAAGDPDLTKALEQAFTQKGHPTHVMDAADINRLLANPPEDMDPAGPGFGGPKGKNLL